MKIVCGVDGKNLFGGFVDEVLVRFGVEIKRAGYEYSRCVGFGGGVEIRGWGMEYEIWLGLGLVEFEVGRE
jgi:hypothetical protein